MVFLENGQYMILFTNEASEIKRTTYDFFGLLNTGLDLRDIPLRFIFGELVDLILSDNAQRLLCVQLALADMACIAGACRGHGRLRSAFRLKPGNTTVAGRKLFAHGLGGAVRARQQWPRSRGPGDMRIKRCAKTQNAECCDLTRSAMRARAWLMVDCVESCDGLATG